MLSLGPVLLRRTRPVTATHGIIASCRAPHSFSRSLLTSRCNRFGGLQSSPFRPLPQSIRALARSTHSSVESIPGSSVGSQSESSSGPGSNKKRAFPEVSDRKVAYWLLGSAASVFGIVVFGGLTRLTESGLSITEWRPVTGSKPPTSQEDWQAEFDKYRSSPEFKMLNSHMDLEDFKRIYWMEWTHRLWGRVIGVSFVLPAMYFIARKKVSPSIARRLVAISGLIGLQGYVGWWMVKSGLKDELFEPGSHPRVSQYRLAVHLGLAFVVYSLMLSAGLRVGRANRILKDPAAALKLIEKLNSPVARRFRTAVNGLAGLVFLTVLSGALVAGLDAGLIYNEFPMMGKGLAPPHQELWDERYAQKEDKSDLWWRNMTANPSLVQLDHRILAMTTFSAIVAMWTASRTGRMRAELPKEALKGMGGVLHLALLQVTLGISTLIYLVPTWLAGMHQAGSLALLTGVLVLRGRMAIPPARIAQLVRLRMNASGTNPSGMKIKRE